ncbi:MAG TPA: efflux RND transporter periplasmic adaptor subunit [Desulfuromonadaceae bacterium]|jgi:RND family efflux transporter MFP subunit
MRNSFRFTFYLLSILFILGCKEKRPEVGQAQAPASMIKGTTLEIVKSIEVPETLEVTGSVRPRTSAVVSARIPGTIVSLQVREGDRVRKGQLLARLNAQETSATAASAVAGIDEAGSALKEAISRKQLSDATFERYQQLFNEQAITRQEFDTKRSEQELARQGVARAESRLIQARQGSLAASTMAGFTRITAPISGLVVSKQAALGATVFPAQPLVTIEEQGNYQLEMLVPESLGGIVKSGATVKVTLDALNANLNGTIAEVVPTNDPASRTFIAKVNLGLPGLKSGMFGRGTINLGQVVKGIMVPKRAIIERGALACLWAVDKDNIAHLRIIKAGRTIGERVEILAGLTEGERIATNGLEKVSEGVKLE